jgi:hypothetical protein
VFGAAWYTAGLLAGLGAAFGVLIAGLLGAVRGGTPAAFLLGLAGGALIGALPWGWPEGVAGGFGGAVGALGAIEIVRGTLGRGGTRAGTAALVGIGAVMLAAFALVPLVGYAEAVLIPALGGRLRRLAGRSYAGLRILARD